jgi:serine/threonine-protein kinase
MSEGAKRPDPARIEELFDALIDLPTDEAARRLALDCEGDEALRAAVLRLLAHDRAVADTFLAPSDTLLVAAAQALHEPEVSARLGRFFVLRKLGEGGMGAVYLGYDESLDRRVALKLLHRRAGSPVFLQREGQALGRLAHPNVVAVHEIGEHEGRVFLAMELVEGPTLSAWLAEEERPFAALLEVFVQAGSGLQSAHAAGLVHRDFKPDNVLIGKDGRARVADFGIAAPAFVDAPPDSGGASEVHQSPSAFATPLTADGALVGTPAFMSPEQIRGERATPAGDQWSFCVALYRAAYGAPPFPDAELAELLRSVTEDRPAPPPRRAGVPEWLAPIVLRGLARDPAARFPSMDALLAAIDAHRPRDPDLDPAAVRAGRRSMAAVAFLLSLSIAGVVFGVGRERVLAGRWALVRLALVIVAVIAVALFALRRRILHNLYGRRLAGVMLAVGLGLLAHRLVALRLGTPLLEVLGVDQVVLAAIYGVAAVTFERWMGWLSMAALLGAAISVARLPLAVPCFALTAVGSTIVTLFMWGRRA